MGNERVDCDTISLSGPLGDYVSVDNVTRTAGPVTNDNAAQQRGNVPVVRKRSVI